MHTFSFLLIIIPFLFANKQSLAIGKQKVKKKDIIFWSVSFVYLKCMRVVDHHHSFSCSCYQGRCLLLLVLPLMLPLILP